MRGLSAVPPRSLVAALLFGALAGRPLLASPSTPGQTAPRQAVQTPSPAQAAKPTLPQAAGVPAMADLGLPAYPKAQFLASYNAGSGQQFYLFGTTASFTDVIAFYKAALKQKGELVFDDPGIYVFEVGRFREDTMAFPPGITIKDYSTGPTKGYLNPKPGAQPSRFPTVIQVVPVPPTTAEGPKR